VKLKAAFKKIPSIRASLGLRVAALESQLKENGLAPVQLNAGLGVSSPPEPEPGTATQQRQALKDQLNAKAQALGESKQAAIEVEDFEAANAAKRGLVECEGLLAGLALQEAWSEDCERRLPQLKLSLETYAKAEVHFNAILTLFGREFTPS